MNEKVQMEHYIKVILDLVCIVLQELDGEVLNRRKPVVKRSQKKVILLLKELIRPIFGCSL